MLAWTHHRPRLLYSSKRCIGILLLLQVSLMNALSDRERTKTRLNEILEERQLVFLEPLLVLERELWSALEREPTAQSLYRCAKESISAEHHTSPAFITALMTVTLRYITQVSWNILNLCHVIDEQSRSLNRFLFIGNFTNLRINCRKPIRGRPLATRPPKTPNSSKKKRNLF